MERLLVSREELELLKREVEGIKSTIEILQDKEIMDEIIESEIFEQKGEALKEIEI